MSDEKVNHEGIPVQWYDSKGCGPTHFALQIEDCSHGLRKPLLMIAVVAGDELTAEDLALLPRHKAVLDGGLSLGREAVADLHRRIGEWLDAHPETAGEHPMAGAL
jgi:hypothetical protein